MYPYCIETLLAHSRRSPLLTQDEQTDGAKSHFLMRYGPQRGPNERFMIRLFKLEKFDSHGLSVSPKTRGRTEINAFSFLFPN